MDSFLEMLGQIATHAQQWVRLDAAMSDLATILAKAIPSRRLSLLPDSGHPESAISVMQGNDGVWSACAWNPWPSVSFSSLAGPHGFSLIHPAKAHSKTTWMALSFLLEESSGHLLLESLESLSLDHELPAVGVALAPVLGLALGRCLQNLRLEGLRERLKGQQSFYQAEQAGDGAVRLLSGESRAMRGLRQAIHQVAPTDSIVLLLGETGTGKELVARAIHQLSPRRQQWLVPVHCAGLAGGVMASELFGHESGAFTGAVKRRIGRFELAHRGTLFLDEVGEIPLETQVMLLRVLEGRKLERVGSNQSVDVDVRLIAATHRDLDQAVTDGRFRADLFYRLHIFPIQVPALRQRAEDIPGLVRYFLGHFNRRFQKQVTQVDAESMKLLCSYHWPGNVRELANLMERGMILAQDAKLPIDPNWLQGKTVPLLTAEASLADTERHKIQSALQQTQGRIYGPQGAARLLAIKPTTLYGKMRKHGIARTQ